MSNNKKVSVKSYLLKTYKENRKSLNKIMAIALFGALITSIIPYIYGRVFDLSLIQDTAVNLLFSLILLWFILSLVSGYTNNKSSFLGDVEGAKISVRAEANAYAHFLKLPITIHKKEQKGKILNKLTRGAWRLQEMIDHFSTVLPQFLMLIFSVVAMLLIRWELALILIFTFLLYGIITVKKIEPILKIQNKEHRIFEREYGKIYNKLYNVFLIKNFAMEDKEKDLFINSFARKTHKALKETAEKWTKLSIIQSVIHSISFVLVLGTAIFFLRLGKITPGEFIMFFGYINLAFNPFRGLARTYRILKRASVAIERFVKLEKMLPEEMKHGNRTIPHVKGGLRFENVTFEYLKDKKVLEKINLLINPGENVALVGKSGVGKTTLSELIMGYYKPQKGKIRLDGVDISRLKLKFLRDQIAIVPQDLSLFNDTLINNLKYANPKATDKQIINATKAASAHEFITKFPKSYKSRVGERGVKLSMGQRQRIAIAMAFLKNPKILILDEPTAALDAESEKKVQEGIKKLIEGKTTIIIAHRFSTVRNADKIVVLDKGRVAEVGNHKELIRKKGLYHKFYSLQKGLD